MSRTLVTVIVLVVLGTGAYLVMSRSSTPPSAVTTTAAVTTPRPTEGGRSLSELISAGGNQKCTWSYSKDGPATSGVVYISGNKVRSEATYIAGPVGEVTAYAVSIGDNLTYWTSLAPDQKMTSTKAEMDTQAYEQFKKQHNYQCESWTPDPSKFAVN